MKRDIRIVIFDRDRKRGVQLQEVIREYGELIRLQAQMQVFTSGKDVLRHMDEQEVDILFVTLLDNEVEGLIVSRYIREELDDYKMKIVFLDENRCHDREFSKAQPYEYITLPMDEVRLYKVINRMKRQIELDNTSFYFMDKKEKKQVILADIVYFKRKLWKTVIVTRKGEEVCRCSIRKLQKQLKEARFVRIKFTILINYDNLISCMSNKVVTNTGETLKITEDFKESAGEILTEYMNRYS